MTLPLVSVVIPTYSRPRQLRDCLDALASQTMRVTDFEVVVIDDGGQEPLDAVVGEFTSRLPIQFLRQNHAGPAAARNTGAREARAPLVAFTDDDCRPYPDWLEKLVAAERHHPGALVGGSTINGLPNDVFATTSQMIIDMVYDHFNADPESAYFLTSNNILCSRARLLERGGFDTGFRRAGAEDRDFCDRWRAAGLKIVWRRDARIEHRHAQSLRAFVDLHHRYGRGAYIYQAKRRARGTGSMREDMRFHRSLLRRTWQRLGRPLGYRRSIQVATALVLWQIVNTTGFLLEANAEHGRF